jgi:MoaA/NifB/PqqE/SkfB family radical SAM enzyme
LASIERDLRQCDSQAAAIAILERAKPQLSTKLQAGFSDIEAKALTVKLLNLLLARFDFERRSVAVASRPFGLVIDPSNTCQLACPGCVHSTQNEQRGLFSWPNGTLSAGRLTTLLNLYGPYAVGAYLCNYGEPLLNLQTPAFIREIKTHLVRTALSTSLSVRKLDADALVLSGLDFMVMSIDGATQGVYEQFRRNGDLALVLANVEKIVEAKRRLRKRTPVLSWNFLAFEHNVSELPRAIKIARKLGVNEFRVVNPFDVGWDDPSIRPAPIKGRVHRLDPLPVFAGNWNPFADNLDHVSIERAYETPWTLPAAPESQAAAGHTCHWLYKNVVMDAGGRIMPCCGAPPATGELVFDHIESPGHDVFNAEKYQQARAHFAGHPVTSNNPPFCTKCDWDHTQVNIGPAEIRSYFRAANPAFFDRRSLRLLSDF